MSRKFKVSSNYDGPSWYDSKAKIWFHTNKVIEVEDNKNIENINKYLIKNLIYEIVEIKDKEEKTDIVTSTSSKLLAKERIKERDRSFLNDKKEKKQEKTLEKPKQEEEPKKEKLPNLDDMTKAELLFYAENKGIKVDKKAKKATILEALKS